MIQARKHGLNHGRMNNCLEPFQSVLQSCAALLEEGIHFGLAKEVLDLFPLLLQFNKRVYMAECPGCNEFEMIRLPRR
jgi:hypothetical protein